MWDGSGISHCGGTDAENGKRSCGSEEIHRPIILTQKGWVWDLIYETKGKIAYITINRPDAMNALGGTVPQDMRDAFIDFRDNPDLWVAIITGTGDRAFSAGADIKGFNRQIDEGQAGGQRRAAIEERIQADTIYKPVIAAINGYCLGGGLELAMTCDIRIAAEHAQFGLPEINIGLIPGGGGTQRLPRLVSRALASEIMFTGNRINAKKPTVSV